LAWVLVPLPSALLRVALGLLGLPCVLLSALMLPGLARLWRRDHWIVRVRPGGVALNVRSALNSDLQVDAAIIGALMHLTDVPALGLIILLIKPSGIMGKRGQDR